VFGVKQMISKDQSYQERFAVGSTVRVVNRAALEQFARDWRSHHPLEADRFRFAGSTSVVKQVGLYRGDVLYRLDGVPGIWHERCLEPPDPIVEFEKAGINVRSIAFSMIVVGLANIGWSLSALHNGATVSFGGTSDVSPWYPLMFGAVFLAFGIAGACKLYADRERLRPGP
jgi:hypothetical protein